MMPPTSIDGTDITGATIDGQDVQEITVDGDTVFSAGPDAGIIDNFEDTPDGIYGPSDSLATYYSGDVSDFARTTTDVIEGSQAITDTADSGLLIIVSEPGDGLNAYPQEGDTIRWLLYTGGTTAGPMVATNTDVDGYLYTASTSNQELQIWRFDNSSVTKVTDESASISSNQHYLAEGLVPSSGNSTVSWELYNVNTSTLQKGSLIGSASVSDSNYRSRGVGWGVVGSNVANFADNLEIV